MNKFTSLLRRLADYLGLVDEYAPCLICGEYVCIDESICVMCAQGSRPETCGIDGCTYPAGPGPWHEPSSACKSGKRPHCTCDYCF